MVGSLNDWQKERQFQALNEKKEDRSVKVIRDGAEKVINIMVRCSSFPFVIYYVLNPLFRTSSLEILRCLNMVKSCRVMVCSSRVITSSVMNRALPARAMLSGNSATKNVFLEKKQEIFQGIQIVSLYLVVKSSKASAAMSLSRLAPNPSTAGS